MSDDVLREAARERLFDAILGEVAAALAPGAGTRKPPRRSAWLVAALVVMGLGVIVGVGWMHGRGNEPAQEKGRWYEQYWPYYWQQDKDSDRVSVAGDDAEALQAVLQRGDVRELRISTRSGELAFDAATWQALGRMPKLEALVLPEHLEFRLEELRQLRRSPNLRALSILGGGTTLDERLAATLCELPKLGMLTLSGVQPTPAGLAALAGLPHLQVLMFERAELDAPTMQALGKLRTLRALAITSMGFLGKPYVPLTAEMVAGIHELAGLEKLGLLGFLAAGVRLDELPRSLRDLSLALDELPAPEQLQALAGLPRLEHLRLVQNREATAEARAKIRALFRPEVKVELRE